MTEEFQALIGILRTHQPPVSAAGFLAFQALIGILRTLLQRRHKHGL